MMIRGQNGLAMLMRAAMLLALAAGLAGCAGASTTSSTADAFASVGRGPTVAFDSIDGPPPHVFDRMVGALDAESRARNMTVVSRNAGAAYRVRSYLAAQISRGQTSIAWVWDVYDANQQRVGRLSGAEQSGKLVRDAWTSADDAVLRRIAQAGLGGLAAMTSGSRPAEPVIAPETPLRGPAVADAGSDDLRTLGFSAR